MSPSKRTFAILVSRANFRNRPRRPGVRFAVVPTDSSSVAALKTTSTYWSGPVSGPHARCTLVAQLPWDSGQQLPVVLTASRNESLIVYLRHVSDWWRLWPRTLFVLTDGFWRENKIMATLSLSHQERQVSDKMSGVSCIH